MCMFSLLSYPSFDTNSRLPLRNEKLLLPISSGLSYQMRIVDITLPPLVIKIQHGDNSRFPHDEAVQDLT